MTFSQLVLSSRYRLFDVREATGQIIDDASKDGVRWSSLLVQDMCKGAVEELLRILTALKMLAYTNEDVAYRLIPELTIEVGGDLAGATLYDLKFSKIIKLQTPDLTKIYSPITQNKFFTNRYFTSQLADATRPIDDCVFTTFFNEATKKPIVKTLPMFSTPIENVQAIVRVPYYELMTLASTDELPVVDVSDLLLDFVERNARRIEHNFEAVKNLKVMINDKLQEMVSGIQRASQ